MTEELCITIKTIELSHPKLLCSSFLGFERMLHHSLLLELLHGPKNGSQVSSVVVHRENKPCTIDSLYCQAVSLRDEADEFRLKTKTRGNKVLCCIVSFMPHTSPHVKRHVQ